MPFFFSCSRFALCKGRDETQESSQQNSGCLFRSSTPIPLFWPPLTTLFVSGSHTPHTTDILAHYESSSLWNCREREPTPTLSTPPANPVPVLQICIAPSSLDRTAVCRLVLRHILLLHPNPARDAALGLNPRQISKNSRDLPNALPDIDFNPYFEAGTYPIGGRHFLQSPARLPGQTTISSLV